MDVGGETEQYSVVRKVGVVRLVGEEVVCVGGVKMLC